MFKEKLNLEKLNQDEEDEDNSLSDEDLVDDNMGSPIAAVLFDFLAHPHSSWAAFAWSLFTCVLAVARIIEIGLESCDGPNQYANRSVNYAEYKFLLTEPEYWDLNIALLSPLLVDGFLRIVFLLLITIEAENHPIYERFIEDYMQVFLFASDILGLMPFFVIASYYQPRGLVPNTPTRVFLGVLELFITGRIMRAIKVYPAVRAINIALSRSTEHLVLPLFFFFVFNVTAGVFFYFAEPCYNLDSCAWVDLFAATFFSIVTMTTTGYGNQVPAYEMGRFMACCVMLFGALFLSMPLAIIGNEYDRAWTQVIDEEEQRKQQAQGRGQLLLGLNSSNHQQQLSAREGGEREDAKSDNDNPPPPPPPPPAPLTIEEKKQLVAKQPLMHTIDKVHAKLHHLYMDYVNHRLHITHASVLILFEMKAWLPTVVMGLEQVLEVIRAISSEAFVENFTEVVMEKSVEIQQLKEAVEMAVETAAQVQHQQQVTAAAAARAPRRLSVFGGGGGIGGGAGGGAGFLHGGHGFHDQQLLQQQQLQEKQQQAALLAQQSAQALQRLDHLRKNSTATPPPSLGLTQQQQQQQQQQPKPFSSSNLITAASRYNNATAAVPVPVPVPVFNKHKPPPAAPRLSQTQPRQLSLILDEQGDEEEDEEEEADDRRGRVAGEGEGEEEEKSDRDEEAEEESDSMKSYVTYQSLHSQGDQDQDQLNSSGDDWQDAALKQLTPRSRARKQQAKEALLHGYHHHQRHPAQEEEEGEEEEVRQGVEEEMGNNDDNNEEEEDGGDSDLDLDEDYELTDSSGDDDDNDDNQQEEEDLEDEDEEDEEAGHEEEEGTRRKRRRSSRQEGSDKGRDKGGGGGGKKSSNNSSGSKANQAAASRPKSREEISRAAASLDQKIKSASVSYGDDGEVIRRTVETERSSYQLTATGQRGSRDDNEDDKETEREGAEGDGRRHQRIGGGGGGGGGGGTAARTRKVSFQHQPEEDEEEDKEDDDSDDDGEEGGKEEGRAAAVSGKEASASTAAIGGSRQSIYVRLLKVIGVEDDAARKRTLTDDFVERLERVAANPSSWKSRIWILLELPSSSREARLLQLVLIFLISLSIFALYTQTITELSLYGETTQVCGQLLNSYCRDKSNPELDPGCFRHDVMNGSLTETPLRYNCQDDGCFGQGANFGSLHGTNLTCVNATSSSFPFEDEVQLHYRYGLPNLFFSRDLQQRANPVCSRIECTDNAQSYFDASSWWLIEEFVINIIFSIELLLRMAVADSLYLYYKDAMNFFDFLAVFPFYSELFSAMVISRGTFFSMDFSILASAPTNSFLVYVRALKVFRMFKLTRQFRASKVLVETARRVWKQIMGMLCLLAFLVVLFAIVLYELERGSPCFVGDSNCQIPTGLDYLHTGDLIYVNKKGQLTEFPNVFYGVWFSFVTLTTTGYGDIVPVTNAGQFMAIFLMIAGQFYMAMPLTAAATTFYQVHEQYQEDHLHTPLQALSAAQQQLQSQGQQGSKVSPAPGSVSSSTMPSSSNPAVAAGSSGKKDKKSSQAALLLDTSAGSAPPHPKLMRQGSMLEPRLQLSIKHFLVQIHVHEQDLHELVKDIHASPIALFHGESMEQENRKYKELKKRSSGEELQLAEDSPVKQVAALRKRIAKLCQELEECLQVSERDVIEVLHSYLITLRGNQSGKKV